ncbi:MAG: hypothetical protein KDD35_13075, partial [Bdellovibrionales bacterium]|nr:hypothetical protein [Bdellovibrionales bacterium]
MSMEDLMTLPEVAKRVFLDCKKCDSGRYHIVLAHTSKTSAKVECEVCKSKKTFKLGKAKKSAPSKKSKSASSAKTGKVSVTKQLEKFTEL